MNGTFYGIGVGPGDPELLTVKAIHAIKAADVLIAPKTEKKEGSVALDIARPYLKEDIEIVYQVFPMVKGFEKDASAWKENKEEILALLRAGKNVYRLLAAESDVDVKTIPGIPAFAAIGSRVGYPIVEGDEVLSIIPATAPQEKIEKALAASDNAVRMKVYKNADEVISLLEAHGLAQQAVLVSRAGLPEERIVTDISAHKGESLNYLSTILTRRQ